MICPICDSVLTENEQLSISHTHNDGRFFIAHEYWDMEDQSWIPKCSSLDFKKVSIDY